MHAVRCGLPVLLGCSFLIGSQLLQADELIMKDSSRLLGRIISGEAGVFEFETSYAGIIKVKWSEVSEMHADEPLKILMENGELIEASHVKNTGEGALLESDTEEDRLLLPTEVVYLNPASWRLGEGYRWTGNINADLKLQHGNTDKDEFEFDGRTQFRRAQDRARLEGQYEKDRSNGDLIDENWFLNGKYDRFINDKLYYGATLGLEHDKFADLDLRTTIGPHIGYQFYEGDEMNLGADIGLMYVDEDFGEAEDIDYWALGWQVNFDRFLVPERIQFYHRHSGLFDSGDASNLVLDSWTGFRFPLYAGIVASIEAEIEYDGGVPDDVDKTDTTYRFKLGYQWE